MQSYAPIYKRRITPPIETVISPLLVNILGPAHGTWQRQSLTAFKQKSQLVQGVIGDWDPGDDNIGQTAQQSGNFVRLRTGQHWATLERRSTAW